MVMLTTAAPEANACGDIKQGKFALSLHAALQSMEPSQKQEHSPLEGDSPSSGESSTEQPNRDFQPYHAQSVPRPGKFQTCSEPNNTQVTTLMFRNIPNKYTQITLLHEIDEFGFADTYNFFYLPMDVHNRSNVGYAFINFETPDHAERFRAVFSDHRFRKFNSRKIGSVSTAHVQGLEENVLHFENRAVTQAKNNQYRPIVLKARQKMDFNDAVAEVKASGVLKASREPVAGIANARQELEAAICDLLTSSAVSVPAVEAASPFCEAVTLEHNSPLAGLLPHPVPLDEPAYVPVPAGATKGLFSTDFSCDGCSSLSSGGQTPPTNGLILGEFLSSRLQTPEPMWCAA